MQVPQKYISEEELRTHNKRDDLWISIHGKVYNVTDWANRHPGGKLPLMYFGGQDVTDAFLANHPKSASKYLELYFTGCHLVNFGASEISQDYRKLLLHFQKMGLFDKKGHNVLILVIVIIMLVLTSVYGVVCSNSFWVHLVCAGMMGFSWIQCGWIVHDSGHYQTMINRRLNRLALFLVANCLQGLTGAGWKRHHDAHHISTNHLEFDPDTHFVPVVVCSSKYATSLTSNYYKKKLHFDSLFKFLISHQDSTYILFFSLGRAFGYVSTLYFLLSAKKTVKNCLELFGVFLFWAWFSLLVSYLPNPTERITFIIVALVVGGIQNVLFFLNHFSCDAYLEPPSGNNWVEKQIVGTLNIKCSPWMDWFHGGLQFQIEHHLFPKMPRCHYRKISPLIKEFCGKHNLPYNCAPSLWEACKVTINTICSVAVDLRNSANRVSEN